MSGMFGQVTPVQVPDFGASAARAQGIQANRLAMLMQQRQMANEDALQGWFAQHGAGFASADPQQQLNLLAQLASQPGGARMALPMMQTAREELEWRGGAQPAAAAPVIQPAAGGGDAPPGDPNLPRGIRNNNPLNLTYVAGQPGVQGSDGRFGRYNTPEEGIAASVRQLQMYGQRGLTTPAQIIGRWAPPGENNTGAYVAAVARRAGLDPNQPINLADPAVVSRLVGAMAHHENGRPIDDAVVRRGVQMALGGDTIPAQAGGASSPTVTPRATNSLPEVPGFDMARVRRAINLPNNAAAQRYLQSYMQAAGLVRRGESEPLERVRRPDGNEVLVPRSQASGMVSAPNPRETPGPFGSGERGRSLQAIEELGQIVARGEATPEQLMRYGSAVTNYQQEEIRPDGSRVTPRLPPYAPPMDWVANRYPSFQFRADQPASPASPGAPPPAASPPGAAVPATPINDAAPAAPSLPAAGASPGLPGAGGTVTRDGAAMEAGTRRQIEEQAVASQAALARLTSIERSYDPQMQTYGNRWSNMWNALRERSGGQLSPQERQRLTAYTQGRAQALENLNNTIKETTGAAMTEAEAARITATMPNPGTGLFDGDSPTEFQAKLQRALNATRNAIVRQNYALSRGLNPTQTGIELDEIPRLYERRGREIEAEIRQGAADADPAQVRQQVRIRLRQEFGI